VPNFGSVEDFIQIKEEISSNVCSKYGLKDFEVKQLTEKILLHMHPAHSTYLLNAVHHKNAPHVKMDFHIGSIGSSDRRLSEIILATALVLFLSRDAWGVYKVNKHILLNDIAEDAQNALEMTSGREYKNLINTLFDDVEALETRGVYA
jgi:hypothetical protein